MDMFCRRLAPLAALLIAVAAGGSARAATVKFSNITGAWVDATPAGNITANTGAGTADAEIRWGGASGYNFLAASSASVELAPSPSADFVLGTFQHVNQPVFSSITSVNLRLSADISVDSVKIATQSFLFAFTHDETNNNARPCPYGGANRRGINVNGCADRVGVSTLDTSQSFLVGSTRYVVDVTGFLAGGVLVTQFLTAERKVNSASLVAQVQAVPEPATSALLLAGLLATGLAARRRSRA